MVGVGVEAGVKLGFTGMNAIGRGWDRVEGSAEVSAGGEGGSVGVGIDVDIDGAFELELDSTLEPQGCRPLLQSFSSSSESSLDSESESESESDEAKPILRSRPSVALPPMPR